MAWLKGKDNGEVVYIKLDNVLEIKKYSDGDIKVLTAPGCYTTFEKGNISLCTERMAFNQIIESEEEK